MIMMNFAYSPSRPNIRSVCAQQRTGVLLGEDSGQRHRRMLSEDHVSLNSLDLHLLDQKQDIEGLGFD